MKKFKINLNRKKLSEQEIADKMDFDKFVQHAPPTQGWLSKGLSATKGYLVAGLAGVAIIAAYLFNNAAKEENTLPFIQPPFDEARIGYTTYSIDTDRDTSIVYQTGSTLNIPAHAFIDERGKEVEGDIQIRYREFHDLYEIILSGIPMAYDSAGTQYQFESAGMFEVQAFKGNEPLSIRSEAALHVNMISHTPEDKFNIYFLDTNKRCWNYVSSNTQENNTLVPLSDLGMVRKYEEKYNNVEPISPIKADKNRPNFTIDYNKDEFPELAVYDDVLFEVSSNDKEYNKKLSERTWEDVSIERTKNSKYTVTFRSGSESHSFNVQPVIDERDYEKAKKLFDQKMMEYTITLNSRKEKEIKEESVIKSNYNQYIEEAKWEDVSTRLNEFRKRDYIAYDRLAIRTFDIKTTGIWNCDWPTQFLSPEFVNATLLDQNNAPLNANRLYLLVKNQNIMLQQFTHENFIENLRYDKNDDCILLAVTQEGFPAIINAEEFRKALNATNNVEFKLNVAHKKIRTPEELKALLN